jgi:putative SOS response-associated peptidase YedK
LRDPFRERRCLVPIDGFYEWWKLDPAGMRKQACYISRRDGRLMVLAGLWDRWVSSAGEAIRSFTVITTAANAAMAQIHTRMPMILDPAFWPHWLGEIPADAGALAALLAPCPDAEIQMWPVGPEVGNVRNDRPSLSDPISLAV